MKDIKVFICNYIYEGKEQIGILGCQNKGDLLLFKSFRGNLIGAIGCNFITEEFYFFDINEEIPFEEIRCNCLIKNAISLDNIKEELIKQSLKDIVSPLEYSVQNFKRIQRLSLGNKEFATIAK